MQLKKKQLNVQRKLNIYFLELLAAKKEGTSAGESSEVLVAIDGSPCTACLCNGSQATKGRHIKHPLEKSEPEPANSTKKSLTIKFKEKVRRHEAGPFKRRRSKKG